MTVIFLLWYNNGGRPLLIFICFFQIKRGLPPPNYMPKQTEQELSQEIEFYGRKLAALLQHLKAPEKIKLAWAALLPKMTIKQISQLLDVLEARYLDEQTSHIDKALQQEIAQVVEKFAKQRKINNQKLISAIEKIKGADLF
ncbi:hypothetical protein COX74_03015 [bacterium (Candidatus Gribaldobacteria) CG_4_10_14_0_2_um_filter_41_16]|uniref:Uncharacterized protein n=3 Tax=Candidatus Gribaldobacteria TaxID=2798536 RepID=A0A2M7VHS0_9BACT|nr:MAG: hypothetical protein COU03_00350 [bacterium (Candidatus Gribaldobacteria) CG10_big_fil_rev_8_21_14_0_10_41_12]PIX03118.1 MAG: hypothetical protein COZ78_02070 [bacterium (Candidatus Gribaldobacteria) CG_4_8_14_3_um_filter_42_11]PJA01388.1 MAG: hypothetical protein COX74_03015 [bacterium (Candidatus Gribaldobacteria) CG_4_10_14_0_2_um_filter_41_16]